MDHVPPLLSVMPPRGLPTPGRLHLWGHAMAHVPPAAAAAGGGGARVVVIGGYGGHRKRCRRADVAVFDDGRWAEANVAGAAPAPRVRHTATLVSAALPRVAHDPSSPMQLQRAIVVFGGRASPLKPFHDVHLLLVDGRVDGAYRYEWRWPPGGAIAGVLSRQTRSIRSMSVKAPGDGAA